MGRLEHEIKLGVAGYLFICAVVVPLVFGALTWPYWLLRNVGFWRWVAVVAWFPFGVVILLGLHTLYEKVRDAGKG